MSEMWDLIGFDNEKLSSHWGFSRRGMHNGAADANSERPQSKHRRKREGEGVALPLSLPSTEAADENSGNRGEQFFRIPLRWKCLDTLFEPVGRSTSFALM